MEFSSTAQGQEADPTEIGPQTLDNEGQPEQKSATGHIAHLADASRTWEAGTNTDPEEQSAKGDQPGKQAILLASALEGMGLITPQEMVLASGQNLDTISHRDTQQTTVRRWIHNVGSKISLFVHGIAGKVNLKLITAKGDANLWAQSGDVEIVGDQNMRILANKKKLTAAAGEEVMFNCGGAFLRMQGGNIEFHCPGKLSIKSANHSFSGPASMEMDFMTFPKGDLCLECFLKASMKRSNLIPMQ